MTDLQSNLDPTLARKANALVALASSCAIGGYIPASKQFQSISDIETKSWDFFMTIGGVFVAVSELNHEPLPGTVKDQVRDIVSRKLNDWNPDALRFGEDCTQFVDRTYDALDEMTETWRDFGFRTL